MRAPSSWLSWSLSALVVLAAVPMVYYATANGQTSLADNMVNAATLLVFAVTGSLIASRQPKNPVGWSLCAAAVLSITGELGVQYSVYGLVTHPGGLPAALWSGLYGGAVRGVGWFCMMTILPLYFPDGRLLSRRWRWLVRWIAVSAVVLVAGTALGPTLGNADDRLTGVANPIGLLSRAAADAIDGLALITFFLIMVGCVASVVMRFRRARGIERQQLKWFVYAATMGCIFAIGFTIAIFFSLNVNLNGAVWYLAIVGMPIAADIAISRYRLYDIDVLINRTLVYGSLTAALAAVYFGSVAAMQAVATRVTGRDSLPTAAIVLSTLLIAALFQPLRRRLQAGIDRRFFHSRYDAAETLAAFGEALRREVDLPALESRLLSVVDEAMRPAHVSLWLRAQELRERGRE